MMGLTPTPFDMDAPLGDRRVIVRRKVDDPTKTEAVSATWGTDPRFTGGETIKFIRSETTTFPRNRCLIPITEFQLKVGQRRYRVELDDGNHFYVAGLWTPPTADWPLSYRVITVPANAEVARYQQRHGAIILRRQVGQWLDASIPERDLLVTPPANLFSVIEMGRPVQKRMAL